MNLVRLYHTLRWLRREQLVGQVRVRWQRRFGRLPPDASLAGPLRLRGQPIPFIPSPSGPATETSGISSGRFGFLGQQTDLGFPPDFSTSGPSKLWAYHLHYFDYLHELPLVFPVHPRTRQRLAHGPFAERVASMKQLRLVEPVGYLDFVKLMAHARVVLTDSGGIQEETTVLRVPCLTLRENTERPVTVTHGTNRVVGTHPDNIITAFREVMRCGPPTDRIPPLWDGQAAQRIVAVLERELVASSPACTQCA